MAGSQQNTEPPVHVGEFFRMKSEEKLHDLGEEKKRREECLIKAKEVITGLEKIANSAGVIEYLRDIGPVRMLSLNHFMGVINVTIAYDPYEPSALSGLSNLSQLCTREIETLSEFRGVLKELYALIKEAFVTPELGKGMVYYSGWVEYQPYRPYRPVGYDYVDNPEKLTNTVLASLSTDLLRKLSEQNVIGIMSKLKDHKYF